MPRPSYNLPLKSRFRSSRCSAESSCRSSTAIRYSGGGKVHAAVCLPCLSFRQAVSWDIFLVGKARPVPHAVRPSCGVCTARCCLLLIRRAADRVVANIRLRSTPSLFDPIPSPAAIAFMCLFIRLLCDGIEIVSPHARSQTLESGVKWSGPERFTGCQR